MLYPLITQLETITNEELTIQIENSFTWEGEYIRRALQHYLSWYLTRPLSECWSTFKELFLDNYRAQFEAQFKNYDPTHNYEYTETRTHIKSDGDETETRTPDATNNYTETTTTYNNTKTIAAGTGNNAPKTDNYAISYDTDPKHTGYTVTSGETTETNITNGTGDKIKTVDNMKFTKTKSHSEIQKTIDGETVSGDMIEQETTTKTGALNANIAEMIREKMKNFNTSLFNNYIEHFISKYCFYVGGDDECY